MPTSRHCMRCGRVRVRTRRSSPRFAPAPPSTSRSESFHNTGSPSVRPILVGAVMYDPKVAVIWDVIARFFGDKGCPMDCMFYTNYELQVRALLASHIDIAWNSPLAWLDAQRLGAGACRAIAMRDTDRDRRTHLLVRAEGPVATVDDLRGRVVALGAGDSPQATLLPLHHLALAGLRPERDFQ